MSIEVRLRQGGFTFRVKVVPRAPRNEIVGVEGGILRVRLQAPPVEGQANAALLHLLSQKMRVPSRNLELLTGEHARQKVVFVRGVTEEAIQDLEKASDVSLTGPR